MDFIRNECEEWKAAVVWQGSLRLYCKAIREFVMCTVTVYSDILE